MTTSVAKAGKGALSYKWLALITVYIGTIMGTMDAGILNISYPILTEVLHTDPSTVVWVTLIYMLIGSGLMLTLGRIGDVWGRKRIYTLGFIIFSIGLALCSVAQNIAQLILFRVVQAVGSAMVVSNGTAIITDAFPSTERGKALGILSTGVSVGFISGPILGGLFLDLIDWRAIFYLRLPVGFIGTAMAWWILREHRTSNIRPRFDLLGAFFLFGFFASLLLGVNQGVRLGWTSAPIIGLGVSFLAFFVLFLITELRVDQPVVDLKLFRHRMFSSANTSLMLVFLAVSANTFLLPFYLEEGLGYSASHTGMILITNAAVAMIIAPISGAISDKVGYWLLCTFGMVGTCSGLFLLSRLTTESTTTDVILRLLLMGIGSGMFQSPNNSAIMGSVPRNRLGTASAMIATVRQMGMSIGLAIAAMVFTSREAFHAAQLASQGLSQDVLKSQALVGGYHDALIVSVLLASIGIFTSLVRGQVIASEGPKAAQVEVSPSGGEDS